VGETSSTRLRAKTIALSRNFYYLWIVLSNIISPYMLNPTQWNLQGKTNFFWAPLATLLAIWAFFRLPEMKVSVRYEAKTADRSESIVLRIGYLVLEQNRGSPFQND